MTYCLEIVNLCLAVCLCVICTRSDVREGIIYNKILVIFTVAAGLIDGVYYGFFANAHRLSKVYTGTQARSSEAQHSYWASTRHILVYRARYHRYYWDRNGIR